MTLTHTQAVVLMVANAAMWSMAGVVTRQLDAAQGFEITFWRSLFTALSLAVTGVSAANKTYDRTVNATLSGGAVTPISGDTVSPT